jgi:hypothetical protein
MKVLFKVKWELIISILLLIASIKGWVVYGYVDTTIQTLAIATMTTFALAFVVIGYKSIETFRHDAIKLWQ